MTETEKHKEIMDAIKDMNDRQTKWNADHEKLDDGRFKKVLTTEELEVVIESTMKKVLFGVGRGTFFWIKTLAIAITAVAVIGGGAKWFIGWVGYTRL